MRRLLVIAGALGMMWSLRALSVDGVEGAVDPMTLAAIGFVVLAAYVVGEISASLKLPRVTGYIVGGVLLGPQLSNILSNRVVVEMQVFNTLALGLIATTAGLELNLKAIGRFWRTLTATVGIKIVALLVLVGGTFWIVQTYVPVLEIEESSAIGALALIFAVLGIGTSPAIALAVVKESGAKGRFSDIALAIAVVKDLVVVVCLAVAIAVAQSMLSPEGVLDAHVLVRVGEELGLSLAFGFGIGLVVIGYIRFVRSEMLLFVVAAVLVAAEVTHWLHLELLLVLITAGFVVRNLSPYEHDLLEPLQRIALPVFVVFFTTAGANVDLHATFAVLPLALALATARAIAFVVAGVIGGRVGGESHAVQWNAWMAYLPQAGVTLGLVFLAAEALPEVEEHIRRTGMALVTLHLLIGPVLLNVALRRAGEVGTPLGAQLTVPDTADLKERTNEERATVDEIEEGIDIDMDDSMLSVDDIATRLRNETLRELVVTTGHRLDERVREFLEGEVAELELFGEKVVRALLGEAHSPAQASGAVASALKMAQPETPEGWEQDVRLLYQDLTEVVQSLPELVKVPLDGDRLARKEGDSIVLSLRKLIARVHRRKRRVRVRIIARAALEGRLAEALDVVSASWFRTLGDALGQVKSTVLNRTSSQKARAAVARALERWREAVALDIGHAIRRGLEVMTEALDTCDTPYATRGVPRYSIVESQVRRALGQLEEDGPAWRTRVDAAFDSLRAAAAVEACRVSVGSVLERRAWEPVEDALEQVLPVIVTVDAKLNAARTHTATMERLDDDCLEHLIERVRLAFKDEDKAIVRRARVALRRLTRKAQILAEITEILSDMPEKLLILSSGTMLRDARRPQDLHVEVIDFAREVERLLVESLLPHVTSALTSVLTLASVSEARLREGVHIATYGLEATLRRKIDDNRTRRELAIAALDRAARRCRELSRELEQTFGEAVKQIDEAHEVARAQLGRLLEGRPATERVKASIRTRAHTATAAWAKRVKELSRSVLGLSRLARRRISKQRQLQDWLITAGRQHLDAADMAHYVRERLPHPDELDLPQLFTQAFRVAHVDDRRLFAAYKTEVAETVRALKSDSDHNILVLARTGMGSTSFLSELEYQFSDRQALRVDGALHDRSGGLVGAVAMELGCDHFVDAVVSTLRARPRVVLVDDLEHLVGPTPFGLNEVESFLRVVMDTSPTVRWVVSTSRDALHVLDEASVSVSEVFSYHIELPQLSWKELRSIMTARHRLAGVDIRYTSAHASLARLLSWRRGFEDELYYRTLARVSRGVLREALLAHVRSVRSQGDDGSLRVDLPDRAAIPFLGQLSCPSLALLALLARFGPMRAESLSNALGLNSTSLRGHTAFLEASLLIEHRPWGDGTALSIPSHIEDAVVLGLRELSVFGEEG